MTTVRAAYYARVSSEQQAVARKNLCESRSRMVKNLKRIEKAWFPVS